MRPHRSSPRNDARGTATTLSHTLTLAMTSLLVLTLMMGVTGFLDDQKSQTAEGELRTIGNRLAGELSNVDRLGKQGGGVTVQTDHPNTVAGSPYDARLEHGSGACANVNDDTCIVLTASEFDVRETIPVHNETELHLESPGEGRFLVVSEGSDTSTHGEFTQVDMSSRIGIGRGVEGDSIETLVDPGNNPPLALFDIYPSTPQAGRTIEFDASPSFDVDGTILEYRWDFDNDGTNEVTKTSPTVSWTLPPGDHTISLEVRDNNAATTNLTQTIDVSGLRYLEDMDSKPGNDKAVTLSVRNEFGQAIEIDKLRIDPNDPDIDSLYEDSSTFHEIQFDMDADGTPVEGEVYYDDGGPIAIHDGGRIFDLPGSSEPTLSPGQEMKIHLQDFEHPMESEELTVGLRYDLNGTPNSTIINDVIGGPSIDDYRVVASGQDVHVAFNSSQPLDDITVQLGGNTSGVLHETDFTVTGSGPYKYVGDVSSGSTGTFWANMTQAESGTAPSGDVPLNDSAIVSGDLTWTSASDWNDADSQHAIVHDSIGDRADDELSLGYQATASGLVGYWPLDEPADGSAPDASGTGNDGTIQSDPNAANGIGVSDSTHFDGSNDHVRVPNDNTIELGTADTVTVSAWVSKDAPQNGWIAMLQHSDESYNLQFNNGNEPEFTIHDDGSWVTAEYGNSVSSNQWHHYVGTYDGSTIRFYVDGSLVDTNTVPDMDETSFDLGIAENLDATGRHLDGKMDEVRLYDRVLSDSEVTRLYQTPTQGNLTTDSKTHPAGPLDVANLKLQYDVENASGEHVRVRVHTPSGESDWIGVPDGTGSVPVSGLSSDTDEFWLEVDLGSSLPTHSPVVHKLAIIEN